MKHIKSHNIKFITHTANAISHQSIRTIFKKYLFFNETANLKLIFKCLRVQARSYHFIRMQDRTLMFHLKQNPMRSNEMLLATSISFNKWLPLINVTLSIKVTNFMVLTCFCMSPTNSRFFINAWVANIFNYF